MKTFFGLFLLFGCAAGFGVELQQATNDQLLQELSSRLSGASFPGEEALAVYSCEIGSLYLDLMGPTGINVRKSFKTPSYSMCLEQIEFLNRFKSKISSLTVVAICDSSGTSVLYKQILLPKGEFGLTSSVKTPSYSACLDQAKLLNGGR